MIVVVDKSIERAKLKDILEGIEALGLSTHVSSGEDKLVIGCVGSVTVDPATLYAIDGVEQVIPITDPFKLASRQFRKEDSIISIGNGVEFGGRKIPVIAGPCSVESEDQIIQTAQAVKKAGASALRGGAFKPRTSPYSFQGMKEDGLKLLAKARDETGLPVVTEVMDGKDVPLVARYADMLQIGTRNMQNYTLLREAGKSGKPVLLKRGMSATVKDLLLAAEYVLAEGNNDVVLCERGIRTFETFTRNTLDVNVIPSVEKLSHLPIVIDPSHATGRWDMVTPAALAGVAAGADGVLVEVHPDPKKAFSDGEQSLNFDSFALLMEKVRAVAGAVGRQA
jgi:3-deoxy-7-phosphoheptulonate synthase